jgi:hypothetical protein
LSRPRYLAPLVAACGAAALVGGGAMVFLRWHHTIGYGGVGIGVLLLLVGGGLSLGGPAKGLSKQLRLPSALAGRRTRGAVVAAVIIGATLGTFAYVDSQLYAQSGSSPGISLNVNSASEVAYPNGTIGVTIQVNAAGGTPPYTFVAQWNDNTSQTSATGVFTRNFAAIVPIATGLTVRATGSNGWLGYLSLVLPSQFPVSNGQVNTKTLGVLPSSGPTAPASSSGTTQTATTQNFVAVFNASSPSSSPSGGYQSTTGASTSAVSGATQSYSNATFQVTSQAGGGNGSANWPFVPSYPATVFVTDGKAYLNASFSSTLGTPVSAFLDTVVSSGGSGSHVPGPVVTVAAGGRMGLYTQLGSLGPGSYTVTFYVVNNANGEAISGTETVQFTI